MSAAADIFAALPNPDIAAFKARHQWLENARNSVLRPRGPGKQLPPADDDWEILLFLAGRGFGKLLDVSTLIPTPVGWTTMGDIKVGDTIFDEAGQQCRVTWASAPQTPVEAYRVMFSDGSWINACSEHQWVTWTYAERKALLRSPYEEHNAFPLQWPSWRLKRSCGGAAPRIYSDSPGPQVRLTKDIKETLTHGARGDLNHCIPQCGPLQTKEIDLPIPPYVLGCWLGDGHSSGGRLHCHQDDMPAMRREFEVAGFPTNALSDPQAFGTHGLTEKLRSLGILNNKRVPPIYLRASPAQRLALLQGLMDTDGGNDNASLVSFTNSLEHLSEAVAELAVSLGMKVRRDDRIPICTNNGVSGQRSYRVAFTPHTQVFRLARKMARVSFDCGQGLRRHHRMITGMEPISPTTMRCITVDSPNSMYLAGRSMIPTHNTAAQVQWAWWEGWDNPGIIIHAVAPTLSDVNGTMFEGDAGFLNTVPYECLLGGAIDKAYNKSRHELRLNNGTLIRGFGAVEEAGRLRGPQCHALIADELREWDRPAGNLRDAMNNALLGLRLRYPSGAPSRAVMGTTPKPIPFLKQFMKRPGVLVVRGTSRENLPSLSASFRSQIMTLAGTALGRQEIDAAFIDEESDLSILKRNWIRLWPVDQKTGRHRPIPHMVYILASYDTAASEEDINLDKQETDPTACIVLGVFNTHEVFTEEERKKYGVPSRFAAILLDAWSGHYGLPQLLDRARTYNQKKFGPADHARKVDMTLIEDKSSGPGVRQFMRLWGLTVYPCKPRVSKAMRMHNISPLIFQGMLWVPESPNPARKGLPIAWADEFVDQVCAFAGEGSVEHDDFVDCLSQGFNYLRERGTLEATPQVQFLDREEKIEFERKQAERQYRSEKQSNRVAPYG